MAWKLARDPKKDPRAVRLRDVGRWFSRRGICEGKIVLGITGSIRYQADLLSALLRGISSLIFLQNVDTASHSAFVNIRPTCSR